MIKAVLFDLDGTLLNRAASVERFIFNQYDRFHDKFSHVNKDLYIRKFIEHDNHGYTWKDQVYQQMVYELELFSVTWEELLDDYLSHFKYNCVPFPHLIEMLEALKGMKLKLGIISNGKGQFQMDNIKALGIEVYLDTILISEWEGVNKPDPSIFHKALKQLAVSPQESIFVGDHPEKDIKAAKEAGMMGVWKKDIHWQQVDADFSIEGLEQIPIIIESSLTGRS
ncbi:HAD family hydrolase [Thalassobacillus pellis]|uniref:HAD family hydrolase n=1 Tax=Thalassobacillus pellis TaxID=748008 RepID=UPI001960F8CD|nr:HAD-IA family hydrolase [Thalassobacillus pellis]MBM7553568.1 putative hydrolase of the HAD superfamily [Thalassobacillus pellis]